MTDPVVVDVFVEDSAHEQLLLALLRRVAHEAGRTIRAQVLLGRGGHAKAIEAMVQAQRALRDGGISRPLADIFLVGIDGNCTTSHEKTKAIHQSCLPEFQDRLVIACPDPHIEKWFMADPQSFARVVDAAPNVGKKKCARDYYKHALATTVRSAGHPALLGGIEFADELVEAMDLYRAGKSDAALARFLDDLRAALLRLP